MSKGGLPPPHALAEHLIRKRPELSDAKVAAKSGLSVKKVRALRERVRK